MRTRLWISVTAVLVVAVTMAGNLYADRSSREDEIVAFNKNYRDMHLNMDTQGIFATWAEDGVDLMPGEAPLIGKKAIVAWVQQILANLPGHKVVTQDMEFHDIHVSGEWASEWATEHQVVQLANSKEPIETYGKMALILHREANGEWKIKQEMWNQGKKP
jgi:ketosteroid isomerase-like protein